MAPSNGAFHRTCRGGVPHCTLVNLVKIGAKMKKVNETLKDCFEDTLIICMLLETEDNLFWTKSQQLMFYNSFKISSKQF